MLHGKLVMATGESFPYHLSFRDSAGVVHGYSYTYDQPNEAKSTIRGELNPTLKTLEFKETGIVSSHDVHTQAFMCLLHAALRYERDPITGGMALKGEITGAEADQTACTGGTLQFTNDAEIKYLFSNHDQSDTVIEMHPGMRKARPVVLETQPEDDKPVNIDKITAGQGKVYDWHCDSIVLEIWDGGNIDGDKITLDYNRTTYLENYFLVKKKKRLVLPVQNDQLNVIAITANNEGSEPPNTANISIWDGTVCYNLLSYNNAGEKSLIQVRRVK